MRQQICRDSLIVHENNLLNENVAIKLISEYVQRLRAGEHPKPEEYIARYAGPKKDIFKEDLYFAALLEEIYGESRKEAEKMLTSERMDETKKLISEKVLAELRKNMHKNK